MYFTWILGNCWEVLGFVEWIIILFYIKFASIGEEIEKLKFSFTVNGNVKWYKHSRKVSQLLLKN